MASKHKPHKKHKKHTPTSKRRTTPAKNKAKQRVKPKTMAKRVKPKRKARVSNTVRLKPTSKPIGYRIIGNKVHYRTKKGVRGSMPKGHVGMIRHWGLKEVRSL